MGFNKITAKKRERAIKLRLQGKSYGHIVDALQLPSKGTLSHWFKGLKLTLTARKKLKKNTLLAAKRGLTAFNDRRSQEIALDNEAERHRGLEQVGKLSKRELMVAGVALYWGEGSKTFQTGRSPILSFANSDPKMVRVFVRFLREILHVADDKIRGGIHIYPGISEQEAREYWAGVTKLPSARFYVGRWVSSSSKGKRGRKTLPYGTAVIRVNSRKAFHHVMGMIDALSGASR